MACSSDGEGFTLVLPGELSARTGGTIYDRRMVEEARALGVRVDVTELPGNSYPRPGASAVEAAKAAFAQIADGERTVVDGLALGALPGVALGHAQRLQLIGLVHHPLCDEGTDEFADLLESERCALGCARLVIVTSSFTESRLRELRLVAPTTPVHVVEPGVDEFSISEEWTPGSELRLLSVGSLTPRKAHVDGIAALAALRSEEPWSWTIVGREDLDPRCALEVRQAIEAAGLQDRIQLTGEVSHEELGRRFRRAHVLLHTARYEGFGMAVSEGLAHGLPVVTSTGGALGQTLKRHGAVAPGNGNERLAGAVYTPGDVDELRLRIARLLDTPERWCEWRTTALEARLRLPSWSHSAESFIGSLMGAIAP